MADLAGDFAGSAGAGSFDPARYRGQLTAGQGTALWSSAVFVNAIGAAAPCVGWDDLEELGITHANGDFTFADAGTYAFFARLPVNGNGVYIALQLLGSVGGVLSRQVDFHGTDTAGEGNRPLLALVTVVAGEVVSLQYARDNSAGASGQFAAPVPTIAGAAFSLGNISIWRIA